MHQNSSHKAAQGASVGACDASQGIAGNAWSSPRAAPPALGAHISPHGAHSSGASEEAGSGDEERASSHSHGNHIGIYPVSTLVAVVRPVVMTGVLKTSKLHTCFVGLPGKHICRLCHCIYHQVNRTCAVQSEGGSGAEGSSDSGLQVCLDSRQLVLENTTRLPVASWAPHTHSKHREGHSCGAGRCGGSSGLMHTNRHTVSDSHKALCWLYTDTQTCTPGTLSLQSYSHGSFAGSTG